MRPHRQQPTRLSVPGILQARTLEWVAISFYSAWKWKVKVKSLSRVWLLATPWTAAYQAPPSMGFSRQEYWSGLPSITLDMQIYHPYGRKWRRTKEPLDESERGKWKSWLKAQCSENEDHGIWSHQFMGNRWGNSGLLYFLGSKSLQMVTAAMKLKDTCSLESKLWPT